MQRMTFRDIDEERFFKVPKVLNEDNYYKDLSVTARYLYGVMLDRFSLSKSRNWINGNGEVYFIFKQKALAELLNISESSIKRSILQLKQHNLIESESTMTVNLYYISFPMPKTTGQIDLTVVQSGLTNSSNRPNNSDTDTSDTNKNKTELLHRSNFDVRVLNLLNSFAINKFGKSIRKHKGEYDLLVLEDMDDEELLEVFELHLTKYEYANLDYLQTIQCREL